MISSYAEALRYLYDSLPMFQHVGAAAYKRDLTNIRKLCAVLGEPQNRFRSVHVGGTNGKGSTSHMLASILQEAGYTTGLYTSPHLKSFTERIRVNGSEIDEEYVVDFVNRIRPHIEQLQPSFFEITVAMAFEWFALQRVDVAVVEVGMGGRLDSTNIITPVLAVITNIGLDHQQFLGQTLEEIAGEKAGIVKSGVPLVVGQRQREVEHVFAERAAALQANVVFASDKYTSEWSAEGVLAISDERHRPDIRIAMTLAGAYQRHNVVTVLAACEQLKSYFALNQTAIRRGIERVVINTGLKGRWQQLLDAPRVICDTGHNADGIREIVEQLRRQTFDRLFIVFGVVNDKDLYGVLSLLPREATYYFCQAKVPRALDAQVLKQEASRIGLQGEAIPDVNTALKTAIAQAGPNDLVFVGGSTFVVAEVDQL